MSNKSQMIPLAGLLATVAVAAYMVVQLKGQEPAAIADFTQAAKAEVRDAQGLVMLRGSFVIADEDDDDTERRAVLEAIGGDATVSGEAEVEFAKTAPATQEIEFSVRNLQPGATVTFVIDGVDVATATVDPKGRAEFETDVRLPAGNASRTP